MSKQYTIYLGITSIDYDKHCKPPLEQWLNQISHVITQEGIRGATITPSFGLWEGKLEYGYTISIINTGDVTLDMLYTICRGLNKVFHQQCILLTTQTIKDELI